MDFYLFKKEKQKRKHEEICPIIPALSWHFCASVIHFLSISLLHVWSSHKSFLSETYNSYCISHKSVLRLVCNSVHNSVSISISSVFNTNLFCLYHGAALNFIYSSELWYSSGPPLTDTWLVSLQISPVSLWVPMLCNPVWQTNFFLPYTFCLYATFSQDADIASTNGLAGLNSHRVSNVKISQYDFWLLY